MEVEKLNDPELYREASQMTRIGKAAVREAQENLRSKGLPVVFSRRGKVFYEMPNGEITSTKPT